MEEFIYIIIGVLWLAASIYKASKKKKQNASPHKPATTSKENVSASATRSLLEELLDGQKLRIPEPEVVEMEYEEPMMLEVEELPKQSTFQSEYASFERHGLEALTAEGVSSLGRITFTNILKETEKKASHPVKIDLRKAIIYSAILERPYT